MSLEKRTGAVPSRIAARLPLMRICRRPDVSLSLAPRKYGGKAATLLASSIGGTAAAVAAPAAHGAAKRGNTAVSQPISGPLHVLASRALATCSSARQIDDRRLWIRFEWVPRYHVIAL